MERQKGHTVCTALDQRNWTGAPQLGQLARVAHVRWLMENDTGARSFSRHRCRAELQLQLLLKFPQRVAATEYIQANELYSGKCGMRCAIP